ncbi:MAG TPA: HlyD family secretion protein [bacterium]|nr:HlyD family secretion protein [bacterium]
MNDGPSKTDLGAPRPPVEERRSPAAEIADGRAAPPGAVAPASPGTAPHGTHDDGVARVARTVVETAARPRLHVRRIALLGTAAVGVIVLFALIVYWRANIGIIKTDNAQTHGDISPVSSMVPGTIVKMYVVENQHVAIGDALVGLDPQDYQVALARAKAALTAAQAQVQALQAALGVQQQQFQADVQAANARVQATQPTLPQAEAQLDMQDRTTAAQLARANARVTTAAAAVAAAKSAADTAAKTLARDRQLIAQGAIAQQQLDTDASAYESARAQYQAAQDALAQAKSDVQAAQAARQQVAIARSAIAVNQGQLSAAQAQVQQAAVGGTLVRQRAQELAAAQAQAANAAEVVRAAQLNLDRTVVRSPVEGWVTNRSAEVGQVIQPNQPLLSVTQSQRVWVVANIKETQLGAVHPGQPVRIRIDTYRARTFRGQVESVGAATGSTTALLPPDNATGNFVKVVQLVPVRIILDPRDVGPRPLQVGLSAEVAINTRGSGR